MFVVIAWWLTSSCVTWSTESAVLDPALYLSPSPPMRSTSDSIPPETLWSQPLASRRERDTTDITVAQKTVVTIESKKEAKTERAESMGTAETFWPSLRTTAYSLRGIHIPLTFSISGTYGSGPSSFGTGIIGSSYASISNDEGSSMLGSYGKSALAGSSYGTYSSGYPGIRVFGNSGKAGWSGWSNGKWGHYGKG